VLGRILGDLCGSASTVQKTIFGGYAVKAEKLSLFNVYTARLFITGAFYELSPLQSFDRIGKNYNRLTLVSGTE